MKINVKTASLELDARTREEIQGMMEASLGRLAHRILRVSVCLADENGPRGGRDISCIVDMRLRPRGRLFIRETGFDLPGVVRSSADSAATTVSRALERTRDLHRRAPPRPEPETSGA
jgi:putative sigma-54 modulation protein